MRARSAAVASGVLFVGLLYVGAALLWTSYEAVPGSLGWLMAYAAFAGLAAAFLVPRPVGGRVFVFLLVSAVGTALALSIMGFSLGRHAPVEPFTFAIVVVVAMLVWALGFALGQLSRRALPA